MVGTSTNRRLGDWLTLAIAIATVIMLNILGSFVFERFDLTSEKRYSLSSSTEEILENLPDVVLIRVYLEGNLPAEFREFRNNIQETLDEMRAYSGGKVEYVFINPSSAPTEEERIAVYQELTKAGLEYTNIRLQSEDKVSEQIIFPGAIVAYGGVEVPLQLLKNKLGASQQDMISNSIQQLEYEFISALQKLMQPQSKVVAFVEGHGEFDAMETADIEASLKELYTVERITINEKLSALEGVDAIIIARPDSAYSEKDKFVLDQFIMRGGKVLWMIDPVFARMDSLQNSQLTMGLVLEHNLTDQLFKYGVRLNNDLILDLECVSIPIVTGQVGDQPKQEMFPWYYSPLLSGNDGHPISLNLDRVKTEFTSTVESLELEGIKATTILSSSDQTKLVNAPTRVSFNILREAPRYELFNTGPHAVAVLLEGRFESVFKNRLPKRLVANEKIDFLEMSDSTQMIVVSDGDIIRNPGRRDENRYFTLGYDRYTNKTYGNKAFVLNAINYLLDDQGLLNIRSKEFKIRLLDQAKIDEERFYWQFMNTAVPIVIVVLFGFARTWMRKRKYS